MLSATSFSYWSDELAAELGLTAVQLAHVRARVRRLQPGHAVRAAQLDHDHVGPLGLAAQRLQERRPAARAHGHRGHGGEPIDRPGRIAVVPHVSSGRLPGSGGYMDNTNPTPGPDPLDNHDEGRVAGLTGFSTDAAEDVPGVPHRPAVAAPPRRPTVRPASRTPGRASRAPRRCRCARSPGARTTPPARRARPAVHAQQRDARGPRLLDRAPHERAADVLAGVGA